MNVKLKPNARLILASTSRYRRELLAQTGLAFEVIVQEIDETPLQGETPAATCARLAIAKARAALAISGTGPRLIIGSDQVLDDDGVAISKPGNFEQAFAQLMRAQGRTLTSFTALALIDSETNRLWSDVVETHISYRALSASEITAYLKREQPYDCAGSVKVERSGITLLSAVQSNDPSALIGLPLIRLCDFLREAGHDFQQ
jgi:septum formation protein